METSYLKPNVTCIASLKSQNLHKIAPFSIIIQVIFETFLQQITTSILQDIGAMKTSKQVNQLKSFCCNFDKIDDVKLS